MIRTYRTRNITEKPVYCEYLTVNVLLWNGGQWTELCPYVLRTDGKEEIENKGGIIFENFWQGLKVYPIIYPQEQYASRFQRGRAEHLWFKSDLRGKDIPHEVWRDKVWSNSKPVRYPNGYEHRSETVGVSDGRGGLLDYITSRKRVYVKEYCRLARATDAYSRLVKAYRSGTPILICEVDVPSSDKTGAYGKYAEGPLSVPLTIEIVNELMEDPSHPFGHGLCLALMLLEC